MVAPVTGPTLKTTDTGDFFDFQEYRRQARPYTLALPYRRRVATLSRSRPGFGQSASYVASWDPESLVDMVPLHSVAYERLKGLITSRAEVLVNVIEANKSIEMIRQRAMQMYKFVRHLRRGDFQGAGQALAMPKPPKGATTKRALASNYLEYHFGWTPLVTDIYNAVDHLQNPLKQVFVRGTAKQDKVRGPHSLTVKSNYVDGSYTVRDYLYEAYWVGEAVASMGTGIKVHNPNLFLANSLGLVNPLTVAWEVIPFSFVVDWFVNVQQFLSQGTDWMGLTLVEPWTTYRYKGTFVERVEVDRYWDQWFYPPGQSSYFIRHESPIRDSMGGTFVTTRRSLGINGPDLHIRPLKLWGWRRAAAAVSLLVTNLGR